MFKEKIDKFEIICSDRIKYNQQILKESNETSKNKIIEIQVQGMDLTASKQS